MDARAMIDVQERQVLGLPGLTDLFPTPTITIGRPRPTPSSSISSSSSSSVSSSSSSPVSSATSESSSSSSSVLSTSSDTPTPTVVLTTLPQSTQIVTEFHSATPSASAAADKHTTSFLQNKVLSGIVFTLAGIIGLCVLVVALTFIIRRKRNRRLVEDAVSFDPVNMGTSDYPYRDTSSLEAGKGQGRQFQGQSGRSNYSRSSGSTGHVSNGPEVRMTPSFADYVPPPPPPQKAYQYQYQHQSPSMNTAAYPQQNQGYNYDYGNPQAYTQPHNFNNIPSGSGSATSPVSPSQYGDPYGGISLTPQPPSQLEQVDRSRRRSKSSSTDIKFAPSIVSSNNRVGEMR